MVLEVSSTLSVSDRRPRRDMPVSNSIQTVSWPARAIRNVDSRRATRRGSVLATDKLTSRASRLIGHALESSYDGMLHVPMMK